MVLANLNKNHLTGWPVYVSLSQSDNSLIRQTQNASFLAQPQREAWEQMCQTELRFKIKVSAARLYLLLGIKS